MSRVCLAAATELVHTNGMKLHIHQWGIAFCLLTGCASHAVRQSVQHYESGDYEGSRSAAASAIENDKSDNDGWKMKLRAELALGAASEVALTYAKYVEQRSGRDDRELLRELAQATLAQGIKSPAALVRVAAIAGVEQAQLQDLADLVMTALGDDDPRVAATAAIAVMSAHPDAAKIAEVALHSDDPMARRIAVNGIGRKVGMPAIDDIRAAATDREPSVRRVAIRWLGQLHDANSIETLKARLRDKDDAVRGAAASAIVAITKANAIKVDLAGLARQQVAIEGLATRLGGIDLAKAAAADDVLRPLAADQDPTVALAAAVSLTAKDQALVLAAFERARKAEHFSARAGAVNVASRAIGDVAAVPFYKEMLKDPNPSVRLSAARALMMSNDVEGKAAALALFVATVDKSDDTDDRISAASDLAMAGDKHGTSALSEWAIATTLTADERTAVVTAHRMGRVITPGLVAALADASGQVRVAAANVLLATNSSSEN
jgi:HEAT repeat protein